MTLGPQKLANLYEIAVKSCANKKNNHLAQKIFKNHEAEPKSRKIDEIFVFENIRKKNLRNSLKNYAKNLDSKSFNV
jgi:hypothetical protein